MRRRTLAALPTQTTGIWPWWTYEQRSIPGIGQAMVNVGTRNAVISATDVDIPEGGLDLAFRRVYNSQSLHNAANGDESTPSVYGNRWTNDLDVHLAAGPASLNTRTVSVYTGDGAREDYSCRTNVEALCAIQTPGVHDLLATVQVSGGAACQLQWTKKSGTSYLFTAPYAACGSEAGQFGRLVDIFARNALFYVHLAYSWSPDASSPQNLTRIVATHHPDGTQLVLTFGRISGRTITELMSITRPDGQVVDYQYSPSGDLVGVDKPGNSPILVDGSAPVQWPNGSPIPAGNLPELYDVDDGHIAEACGPRAAIAILQNRLTDGACVDFDYTSGHLADWWTRGVLNPTPSDGVLAPSPIHPAPVSTDFVRWEASVTTFVPFTTSSCPSPGTALELSDGFGHDVRWCYDARQRVTKMTAYATGTHSLTTSQTWDADNNLTSMTDARGYVTDMAYDANGNTLEVSLPLLTTSIGSIRPTSLYDYDAAQ